MRRSGRIARRAATARTAALVAVLAGSTLAAGVASASGTQGHPPARSALASLTYRCRFPSGPRSVRAAVRASLPAAGRTGKPIQPTQVSLTLAMPAAAAASLRSATVRAETRLTVSAAEGPSAISIVWPGATRSPIPRPARGTLTLTTGGAVPAVATNSAGAVILTAAGLSVTLISGLAAVPQPGPAGTPTPARTHAPTATPALAGTPTPGTGSPTAAPAPLGRSLDVTCTLAAGQDATLGSVLITGKTTGAGGAGGRSAAKSLCPKLPPGGLKLNPRFPPPKPPKGVTIGSSPAQGCAFTAGYADARKLKGAAFVQPGLTNVDLFVRTATDFNPKVNYAEFDNAAQLDFHGKHEFPPSTATFLTFGFVPTTATIELVEHGTVNIFAIGPAIPSGCPPPKSCDTVATVSSRLSVLIVPGSVKVNGVPLNVGSNCGTPQFDAILTGTSASIPPYNVVTGGPLTGLVNIPKFSNCGVGEKLDPIFNAAISGTRNFNLLTQGPVCFLLGGGVCGKTGPVLPNPILHKVIG